MLLLPVGLLLLFGRRRAPLVVLVGNLVASALYYSLDYRFAPVVISLVVAVVSAVTRPARHTA